MLVEPNGTTGSYILFDKVTLLPIATVNQAGQMIQISGGNVSITNALMSPDIQKLITDVFTLKFTDNNTNTKLTTNFTDTITPTSDGLMFKTQNGYTATAVFTSTTQQGSDPGHNPATSTRIPGPPQSRSLDANGNVKSAFALTEHANATGDHADGTGDTVPSDTVSGLITFVDQNLGDQPTVSISLGDAPNYVYKNAGQQDVTSTLSALQKQDIAATQIDIHVVANAGNNNNGSAIWTYTIPDHVFDFLAEGETLTLTYKVRVNNNFSVNPESSFIDITITVTGTNDKPVITTSVPAITFEGGTSVPGGPLTSDVPTTGTLNFTDVDLTDKHTVKVALTSATLPDGTVPPGPLAAFQSAMSVAIAAGADSTGDGTGTINWSLADLPVYLADFIPKGEVLTLVYTVTLTDLQGATSTQTITVTITGTDAPAVVWIATNKPGVPPGGFWKDAGNWATGTVPTISDDVIVITDQLHGLTPSYPVTIDTAAYAKSITMNDFGGPPPKVIVQASLTISGALNMGADSIFVNAATGTMSVGGKAEILDTAVFTNAGYLTLAGGGDFAGGTTITNSGTIELSGGALKTLATIHNANGTLKADAGATLIVDTATIDGGTVTILGTLELDGTSLIENGTLNNSGAVNVKGTVEFAHETVSNTSSGTIKVLANGWLTIDQGSSVTNNGAVTVDASGKLTINGATIDGAGYRGTPVLEGSTGDTSGGALTVITGLPSAGTVTNNGELDLTGNAVLTGGILKNNATLNASGAGNALDHETITNAGIIEVLANGALTIDQGSTVNNTGDVTVDSAGKLTVNGATISGVGTVTDNGEIDLTGNAVLSGGVLKNNAAVKVSSTGNALDNETITNGSTGTIEVLANGALTIDQGSFVTNTGNVTVDATGKLTVNGATISGAGTVTDNGEIDLTGNAVLTGGILTNNAVLKVSGTGNALDNETITNSSTGTIEVLATGALTIDQGSSVSNTGNVTVDATGKLTVNGATISGAGTVTDNGEIDLTGNAVLSGGILKNNAAFKVGGTGNALDNETITNSSTGTIEVLANGALTIDQGSSVNNTGNVTVDATGKLTVNGASISGAGTITDSGEIDLTGDAVLSGGILKNNAAFKVSGTGNALHNETVTNSSTGTIEVLANGALTIDQSSTVNNTGNVIVDGNAALTLDAATISGGAIKGSGTIDVTGASKIDGGATVSISTITADAALTLDGITVSGTAITDNSSVALANTVKLKDGAKIQGGPITNNGTLEIAGTATLLNDVVTNTGHIIKIDDGQTLTLSGTEITGGAINNYSGALGGTIDVTGDSKIDGNATLTKGAVTVESGYTLTFGDATVATTAIANHGAVKVEASKKLTMNGASLTGGTLTVLGTLDSTGATTVTNASITNSGLIEALCGLLTLAATTSATIANAGTLQANGGELDINGEAVTNTGTLAAINDSTLKLIGMTVTNTGVNAAVSVASGSTLDLQGAAIDGGTVTIAGTLESTGTSAIDNADINNTGTISVTSGTLTIDPGTLHAITNGKSIQAVTGGTLKLTTAVITNTGTITVDGTSKLYLTDVTINGGSLSNAGNLYSVGVNTVTGSVTNTGTIEVQGGTLNLSGGVTGAGTLIVDDKATLELGGADAQTVTFAGNKGTLQLDATSHAFSGTIAGTSSKDGTFTVTGAANITTSSGDALDFTASGGTTGGNVVLTPTGTLTGYDNGIAVIQNGIGDISLTTSGAVTGQNGNGIVLHDGATGAGAITATIGGNVSGAVGLDVVSHGGGVVTIANSALITGTTSFGIHVDQDDTGATGSTHITNTGSVVGANGVAAISIQENATGAATIDNSGTIGTDAAVPVSATTYAIVETGGHITINNTGHIDGNISVATATFNNNAGGTWTVAGSGVFGNASSIVNHGDIDLHGASISGTGLSIANYTTIDSWGTASISGTITNTGTIEVHNGALSLFGSLSGTGSVTVDVGALLKLEGDVTQTISLAGDGAHLQIDTSAFDGSIAALSANDTIDLSTIKYGPGTSAVYAANSDPSTGGVLTVTDAYGNHISLTLTGADYSHAHFAGSDDGTGNTLITIHANDDAPAFTAAGATLTASVAEQENATGDSATLDPTPAATGSIDFTDIDLTDRPTVTKLDQVVTSLAANGTTDLTASLTTGEIDALKAALTYELTGKNNGTVTWHYSIADSALDFLGQDQTAKVVSTITLDDGEGKSTTADVIVTITGKNDTPTLADVTKGPLVDTAIADSFSDITGTLSGIDADYGETATLKYAVLDATSHAVTTVAGLYGSLTVNEDGTYSYVPNAAAINALAEGNYTDTFTIQTKDAHDAVGQATFKVNVTGANDTPTLSAVTTDPLLDTAAADSFSNLTGTLHGGDADTGETATLKYAVLDATDHALTTLAGHYGSLTVNDDGTYSYVPDAAAINALSAGNYTDTFTVQTRDIHGATSSATFTVNVTGANDTPALSDGSLGKLTDTATADSFSDITGQLAGTDADTGDTLSYALLNADHNAVATVAGHYGALTVNTDGTYTYVPDAASINALPQGSHYSDSFTVQVSDAHGAVTTATYTVDLTGANDTPVFSNGSLGKLTDTAVADSFSDLTGQLAATDADTGDTLSYALLNADHNAVATIAHQYGALTVNADGSYTYVPDAASINALPQGSHYSDSFTVQVSDAHGAVTTAIYTVDLTGANDTPTLANLSIGPLADTAAADSFSNITGQLTGTDADTGDTLTYAVLNADHHAATTVGGLYGSLTVNSDGSYSYVPNAAAIDALSAGDYTDTFTVQTTDAHNATAQATVTVNVTGANDAPVINTDQVSVSQEGDQVFVHGLSVTDVDAGADETFTLTTAADSGTYVDPASTTDTLANVNSSLQYLTYSEPDDGPATDTVAVKVTDGHGATDTVNLIFNLTEERDVTLASTTGKDVLFGTGYQDQFVFAANSNHDTILNFTPNEDHINLTAVVATDIDAAWIAQHVAASPTNSADTLITIDSADTILLKGVTASNIHASDFIVHSG